MFGGASVSRFRDRKRWQLRAWANLTVQDGEGARQRRQDFYYSQLFERREDAERRRAEVQSAHLREQRFVPGERQVFVTIETIVVAYVGAAVDAGAPLATQRFRSSMVGAFESWIGRRAPVSDLSEAVLRDYAAALTANGCSQVTRHRKILEVERMWAWAARQPSRFPGVPAPCRVTGQDADSVKRPPPVMAFAVPTWTDVDAMIACLDQREWHQRAAIVQRFTGLRIGQVLNLHWRDLDLDRGLLVVRAGVHGAKASGARRLPLHPALALLAASWGPRAGVVFPRAARGGKSPATPTYREDALVEPFRRAWVAAGVPPEKWGAPNSDDALPGDRAHARPTHAIRAAVKSGLIGAGVADPIASYLLGHKVDATHAAYVPGAAEDRPEDSPRWAALVRALEAIPAMTEPGGKIIPLRGGSSRGGGAMPRPAQAPSRVR